MVASRWGRTLAGPWLRNSQFAVSVSLVFSSRRCLSSRRCSCLRCFSSHCAALRLARESEPALSAALSLAAAEAT